MIYYRMCFLKEGELQIAYTVPTDVAEEHMNVAHMAEDRKKTGIRN